jgi:hypothetical protein
LDSAEGVAAAPRGAVAPAARGTCSVAEKVCADRREPRWSIRVAPVACCVVLGSNRVTPRVPV